MLSSTRLSARRSALAGRALARPVAARLRRARPAHSRTVTQAIFERYSEMSIKAIMRAQTMAKDMGYSEVRAEQRREEGGVQGTAPSAPAEQQDKISCSKTRPNGARGPLPPARGGI